MKYLFFLFFVIGCFSCSLFRHVPREYEKEITETFAGHDRATAKTTIIATDTIMFESLECLLEYIPTDSVFKTLNIKKNTPRQPIECVTYGVTCFLYGISFETDHDFHCIMGDSLGKHFMNCEVTGLPDASNANYALFKSVRDSVKSSVGTAFMFKSGYTKFAPAKKVTIIGSLFFDCDHAAGIVGFDTCKAKTAVELHPLIFFSAKK